MDDNSNSQLDNKVPREISIDRTNVGKNAFAITAPITDGRTSNVTHEIKAAYGPNFFGRDFQDPSVLQTLTTAKVKTTASSKWSKYTTSTPSKKPTTARDFVDFIDASHAPPHVKFLVTEKQCQDLKIAGVKIHEFYEQACASLGLSQLTRREHDDARKQQTILHVNVKYMLPSISSNAMAICGPNDVSVYANPSAERLLTMLRDIGLKFEAVFQKSNIRKTSLHTHLIRRKVRSPKPLRKLQKVIRQLENGSEIDDFQRLCLEMNPLEAKRFEIEAVLRKYNILSKASSGLLQSIGMACSAHKDHTVWLGLDADGGEIENYKPSIFHIAFSCDDAPKSTTSFRVESRLDNPECETQSEVEHDSGASDTLPAPVARRSPQRRRGRNATKTTQHEVKASGIKKRRIIATSLERRLSESPSERRNSMFKQLQREFCLAHYKQRSGEPGRFKVAAKFLTPTAEHHISYPTPDRVLKKPIKLRNFISDYRNCEDGRMAPAFDARQRMRLATLVMKAFLMFSSTDWFRDCWNIDNIFVYNISEKTDLWRFEPVIKATIPSSLGSKPILTPEEEENMVITLGKMLIEVAIVKKFIAPLLDTVDVSSLRNLCKRKKNLWNEIVENVGQTYAEIVEECVQGGHDHINIRTTFHRTIWAKLSKLDSTSSETDAQK